MITVVIIAKNEAVNLQTLLPTLDWADSVLIINNDSIDETEKIAREFKAKVITVKVKNNWATLRNRGLKTVKSGWVLFLDADEQLPKETVQEILKLVRGRKSKHDSYQIRRIDEFYGKKLKYGETGQQWLTRLGKVRAGRWIRPVHEVWQTKDPGRLKNVITHKSHQSFKDLIESVQVYAQIEAAYRKRQKISWSLFETLFFPVGKFFQTFFLWQGFRDGWRGLLMSIGMSWHSFLVRKNLYQAWYPSVEATLVTFLLKTLLFIIACLLPWGQLGKTFTPLPYSFYAFEPLMALVLAVWFLALIQRRQLPRFPSIAPSLFFFIFVLLLSLFANAPLLPMESFLVAFSYWGRLVLYFAFGLCLYDMYSRQWISFPIERLLIYEGVGLAVGGLAQYELMPDTRWLFYLGWDDHYFRVIGTLLDPGFLSLLLALTLAGLWIQRLPYSRFLMSLTYIAFVLTYARSGYVVLFVGMFLLLLSKKMKLAQFLGISVLFGISLWFLPNPGGEGVNLTRTYSIVSRAKSVVTAMDLFSRKPIFGVGFNAYKYYALSTEHPLALPINPSAPDNSFALILATSGLMGFLSFSWFLIQFLWTARKEAFIWTSIIMILAHSLTNNSFFYPWVLLWLVALIPKLKS